MHKGFGQQIGHRERRRFRMSPLKYFLIGVSFYLFVWLIVAFHSATNSSVQVVYVKTDQAPEFVEYSVQYGDTLIAIARRYGVTWQELWELNQDVLIENVERHCAHLDTYYVFSETRNGHFCNHLVFTREGDPLVYANTLYPGDTLNILLK